MEIKVGDLTFGDNSDYHLSPSIEGLESPKIRIGDGLYAGRDLGFMSGHYYSYRTIVLKGFFIGSDCDETVELSNTLFNYLRIRKTFPIVVNMQDEQYYTEGCVMDIKSDYTSNKVGEFQIAFACPDPILYLAENNEPIVKSITLTDGYSNKNLFDKTANYAYTGGGVSIAPLDTGISLINSTTYASGWSFVIFDMGAVADFVGKKFTVTADTSASVTNKPRIGIGIASTDYTQRIIKASEDAGHIGHTSYSWTVAATSGYPRLIVWLYLNTGGSGVSGEVGTIISNYENLTMVVGNEPEEYTDFGKVYTTVYNNGATLIYPKIMATGIINGLEISNNTLEKSLSTSTVSTSATDNLTIDMDKRLITLNGNIKNGDRTLTSEWWGLEIEDNDIVLDVGSSNASVVLEYKEGVMGI